MVDIGFELRRKLDEYDLEHLIALSSEQTDRWFLDISTDGEMLSYYTKDKMEKAGANFCSATQTWVGVDFWDKKIRGKYGIKTKPARLLQVMYGASLSNATSIKIKLAFTNMDKYEVVEVTGTDIGKYYNHQYYEEERGSLGNSCMSEKPSSYFMFYSDYCRMIVVRNKDTDRITARAVLYPEVHSFGGFYPVTAVGMIYAIDDLYEEMIKEYCFSRDYYLFDGGRNADYFLTSFSGDRIDLNDFKPYMKVDGMLSEEYRKLPYVDNFAYCVRDESGDCFLTSYRDYVDDREYYIELRTTDGYNDYSDPCDNCTMLCDECNKRETEDYESWED